MFWGRLVVGFCRCEPPSESDVRAHEHIGSFDLASDLRVTVHWWPRPRKGLRMAFWKESLRL